MLRELSSDPTNKKFVFIGESIFFYGALEFVLLAVCRATTHARQLFMKRGTCKCYVIFANRANCLDV